MATNAEKRARLELLEKMRDSGVTSTTVDGVTTQFRGDRELNTAILRLKQELGLVRKRKSAASVFMGHR